MIVSEKQAHELKKFIWRELPLDVINKLPHDVVTEFNKVIDKAVFEQEVILND